MDVLKPELVWVEGRCYRVRSDGYKGSSDLKESSDVKESCNWEEIETRTACYDNEICDAEIENLIETNKNGTHKLAMSISRNFWPFIIGSKGITKRRIESDTNTSIFIPRPTQLGDVVISSASKRSIVLAKKNIDEVMHNALQKFQITHFLSVPMTSDEIKQKFLTFKEEVLRKYGSCRGIGEEIFQIPEKLHFTLAALVIVDDNARAIASDTLRKLHEKVIMPLVASRRPCVMEMKGIDYMNDDSHEVHILYGKVSMTDGSNLLEQICSAATACFNENGLMKIRDVREPKLHVTLMNSTFREKRIEEPEQLTSYSGRQKRNYTPRESFDASGILEEMKDYYFGQIELKTIHLSLLHSEAANGYYQATCCIDL